MRPSGRTWAGRPNSFKGMGDSVFGGGGGNVELSASVGLVGLGSSAGGSASVAGGSAGGASVAVGGSGVGAAASPAPFGGTGCGNMP